MSTLAYDLPGDPLKITAHADPFGRTATFTYTAARQLASLTDVGG
jgi:YD repeat-containing protein